MEAKENSRIRWIKKKTTITNLNLIYKFGFFNNLNNLCHYK